MQTNNFCFTPSTLQGARRQRRLWQPLLTAVLCGTLLIACASKIPLNKAPVEEKSINARSATVTDAPTKPTATVTPTSAVNAASPTAVSKPGAENAGKPGYYTVVQGDTLIHIGLENGQGWRDLARWNNLDNPNRIEVGQVLRVWPPGTETAETGVVTRPVTAANITPVAAGASAPKPAVSANVARAPASAASASSAGNITPPPVAVVDDNLPWAWPAEGSVLRAFDEGGNKGVDIGGAAGAPVLAALDGKVVYVGAAVRGYGNLIIIKHNATYLSAYGHNQTILVKEDQTVHKGQKIAEMGNSDTDKVKLHFEIRRLGKPVDPSKYLPSR